jgi:hypothetical protein
MRARELGKSTAHASCSEELVRAQQQPFELWKAAIRIGR